MEMPGRAPNTAGAPSMRPGVARHAVNMATSVPAATAATRDAPVRRPTLPLRSESRSCQWCSRLAHSFLQKASLPSLVSRPFPGRLAFFPQPVPISTASRALHHMCHSPASRCCRQSLRPRPPLAHAVGPGQPVLKMAGSSKVVELATVPCLACQLVGYASCLLQVHSRQTGADHLQLPLLPNAVVRP